MADYLPASLKVADSAIAEMAVDLASCRIVSDFDESELKALYFNVSLYCETLDQIRVWLQFGHDAWSSFCTGIVQ